MQSISQIREHLTRDLEKVDKSSVFSESVTAMRAACRKLLTEIQEPPGRMYFMNERLVSKLGEVRAIFGIHVARLAYAYDLEVEPDLVSILPPDPLED